MKKKFLRIKRKRSYYIILCFCIVTISCGCKTEEKISNIDAYAIYESDFNYIKDKFNPEDFSAIEEIKNEYSSSTIPDNNFFSEKNDLYNNDPLKPKNRQLLYLNKEKDVVVSLSYVFSQDGLGKSFLTVDSFPVDLVKKNLNDKISRLPYIDQFVMTNKHSILLLKVIYIGGTDISNEKEAGFISQVNKFIKEFTDCLNK